MEVQLQTTMLKAALHWQVIVRKGGRVSYVHRFYSDHPIPHLFNDEARLRSQAELLAPCILILLVPLTA
jgi:hypothetical protein